MLSSPRLDLTLVTKLPVMENILSLSTELGGILPIALYSFFNVGGIVFGFFFTMIAHLIVFQMYCLIFLHFFQLLYVSIDLSFDINQLKQFSK